MHLSLQNIVPSALATRLQRTTSPIWGRELVLPMSSRILVQAPSGTGKSTLVHILYGLNRNYSGRLLWDSVLAATADDTTVSGMRTRQISIIFQDMRLFPDLSARENIELKRAQTGAVPRERTEDWAAKLGIADKMDNVVSTMSFGEQQRVSIIRGLAQPFQWLLMDEPFSHLDNSNRSLAATLISERVSEQDAGMLLADLEPNDLFPYTQILKM